MACLVENDEMSKHLLNNNMINILQAFVNIECTKASKIRKSIEQVRLNLIDKFENFNNFSSIKDFQKITIDKYVDQYDKSFLKEIKEWQNNITKTEQAKSKYENLKKKVEKYESKKKKTSQEKIFTLKILEDEAYFEYKNSLKMLEMAKDVFIQNIKSLTYQLDKIETERLGIIKNFSEFMIEHLKKNDRFL